MWNVSASASDLVYTWDAPLAARTVKAILNLQILTSLTLCKCSHNSYCLTVTTKNICAAIRRQTGGPSINACDVPAAKHFLMHLNRSIIIMTHRFHLKIRHFCQSVNSCTWPPDISQKLIWCCWWKWGENQPRHMTPLSSHTVLFLDNSIISPLLELALLQSKHLSMPRCGSFTLGRGTKCQY